MQVSQTCIFAFMWTRSRELVPWPNLFDCAKVQSQMAQFHKTTNQRVPQRACIFKSYTPSPLYPSHPSSFSPSLSYSSLSLLLSPSQLPHNLTIIELTMRPCVWRPTAITADRRLCSRPHSHESVIFFVFLAFIVFMLRPLC